MGECRVNLKDSALPAVLLGDGEVVVAALGAAVEGGIAGLAEDGGLGLLGGFEADEAPLLRSLLPALLVQRRRVRNLAQAVRRWTPHRSTLPKARTALKDIQSPGFIASTMPRIATDREGKFSTSI